MSHLFTAPSEMKCADGWIDGWNDGRPRPKKGTFGDKSTENENGGAAPENGMGLEKWSESRLI